MNGTGLSAVDRLLAAEEGGPPRADALRNVARLAAAARDALDDVGVDVTAHEIARRAGVGVGTLYRRAGTREALLRAVLGELIDGSIAAADKALADPDPWRGFTGFAEAYVRLRAASCGVNEALGEADGLDLDPWRTALRDRIERLTDAAQHAGVMRADLGYADVAFLLAGVVPGDRTIGLHAGPEQWRRSLAVVLDGLRTG